METFDRKEEQELLKEEEEEESGRSEDGNHLAAFSRDPADCLSLPHLVRAEESHASVQVTFPDIDFPVGQA